MSVYVGVNNVARKVKKIFIGENINYTPLEYIESNGNQWINSMVKAKGTTEFEVQFECLNPAGTTGYVIFGGRDSSSNNNYELTCYNDTSGNGRLYWGNGVTVDTDVAGSGARTIKLKNGHLTNSDTSQSTSVSVDTELSSIRNLIIFGLNEGGAIQTSSTRLYFLKLWDNGTLVRHFIPVKDQNNIVCLFDTISNKFYYNQGVGNFTASQNEGTPVVIGDRAREVKYGYVGINNVARKTFMSTNPLPASATGLFHLDGHIVNELGLGEITEGGFATDPNGKFDSCLRRTSMFNQNDSFIKGLGYNGSEIVGNEFTISFWQKSVQQNLTTRSVSSYIYPKPRNFKLFIWKNV